jgi:hypothetical protein
LELLAAGLVVTVVDAPAGGVVVAVAPLPAAVEPVLLVPELSLGAGVVALGMVVDEGEVLLSVDDWAKARLASAISAEPNRILCGLAMKNS